MKALNRKLITLAIAGVGFFLVSFTEVPAVAETSPLGYIGPGPGLGMIGALMAVLGVILLGLLAPFLIPLRMIRRHIRNRREIACGVRIPVGETSKVR